MNYIKASVLIRVMGLLAEIVGILLLAVYVFACFIPKNDNVAVYLPLKSDLLSDVQVSSKVSRGQENSSNDNVKSKPQSKASTIKASSHSPPSTISPSSKQASSSQASSEQTSSSQAFSEETSSEDTFSRQESFPTETLPPQSVPSSMPPFESSPESKDETDDTLVLENEKKSIEISKDFTVSIAIATQKSGVVNEHIAEFAEKPQDVKSGLTQIESSLKAFPTSYFSQVASDVSFVLAGKTDTGELVLSDKTIVVPCFKTINAVELKAFLLSISADILIAQISVDYTPFNPPDFIYGYIEPIYNYAEKAPQNGYFLSSLAQEDPAQDLYSMFMAIFEQEALIVKVSKRSPFYLKLKYTYQKLVDLSPCFAQTRAVSKILGLNKKK